jgi:hydroxymethylbilane synthase
VKPLRIGTRTSALALWQANHIAEALKRLDGREIELVLIRTSGDRLPSAASVAQMNVPIGPEAGSKGIFIKELEEALLAGTIDLAVHSMKDVPTETPPGLALAAITRREDPRDCLISRAGGTLKTLPRGARIGTSSLRRQAQLRHHRPDVDVLDLRGNVDTRLKKVESGEFDSIVLAMAGLNRLGLAHKVTEVLDEDIVLPAVGQGALGLETRADDLLTSRLAAALGDEETRACVTAERALLEALQGGCQLPLGALGSLRGGELHLEAAVFSAAGSEHVRCSENGPIEQARAIGLRLAAALIESGAEKLLRLAGRTVGQY